MGRAKIAMEPITNHKKRKLTFNTRKQGLIKKARELATLCDVNLSMIIFTDDHQNPEIFPPDFQKHNGLNLIDLYKRNRSMHADKIESYTVFDYFTQRKIKMEDELAKTKKRNLESKYPSWFDFLDGFSEAQLRNFAFGLEHKIVEVESRIESVKNVGHPIDYNDFVIDQVSQNLIMPSSNNDDDAVSAIMRPIITTTSYSDSLMNLLLGGDDNVVYDGGDLSDQPLLVEQGRFSHELLQQFLVSDYDSQVMSSLGADATETNQYLF